MIDPKGKKCQLRVKWSKKEEDVEYSYPLGSQTKCDALLLHDAIDQDLINELKARGYDVTTLKFSIAIDWSNPRSKERFSTLHKAIADSIPQNLNQLSLWDDPQNAAPNKVTGEKLV